MKIEKIKINQECIENIVKDIKKYDLKEFKEYIGKLIYRPHRGGSVFDSLEESKEFNNITEMKNYIVEQWDGNFSIEDIVINDSPFVDERINWNDVRYVCIKRLGNENYMAKYGVPQCIGYCATDYKSK